MFNLTRQQPFTLNGIQQPPQPLPTNIPLSEFWAAQKQVLDGAICNGILAYAQQQYEHPWNYFVNVMTTNGWNNEDFKKFVTCVYGYFSAVGAKADVPPLPTSIDTKQIVGELFEYYVGLRFNTDVNTVFTNYPQFFTTINAAVTKYYPSLNPDDPNNGLGRYIASLRGSNVGASTQPVTGVQLPGSASTNAQGVILPSGKQNQPIVMGQSNTQPKETSASVLDFLSGNTKPQSSGVVIQQQSIVESKPVQQAEVKPMVDGRINFNYPHDFLKDTVSYNNTHAKYGIANISGDGILVINSDDPIEFVVDEDIEQDGTFSDYYMNYPVACVTNRKLPTYEESDLDELPIDFIHTYAGIMKMDEWDNNPKIEGFSLQDDNLRRKENKARTLAKLIELANETGYGKEVGSLYFSGDESLYLNDEFQDETRSKLGEMYRAFLKLDKVREVIAHYERVEAQDMLRHYWKTYEFSTAALTTGSRPWGALLSQEEIAAKVFGEKWVDVLDFDNIKWVRIFNRDLMLYDAKDSVMRGFIQKYVKTHPSAVQFPWTTHDVLKYGQADYFLLNVYDDDIVVETVYLKKEKKVELSRHFGNIIKESDLTPEAIAEAQSESSADKSLDISSEWFEKVLDLGDFGISNKPAEVIEQAEVVAEVSNLSDEISAVAANFTMVEQQLCFDDKTFEFHENLIASAASGQMGIEDVVHRINLGYDRQISPTYLGMVDRVMVRALNDYANFALGSGDAVITKSFVEEAMDLMQEIESNVAPNTQRWWLVEGQFKLVRDTLAPADKNLRNRLVEQLRINLKNKFRDGQLEMVAASPDTSVSVSQETLDKYLDKLEQGALESIMVDGKVDQELLTKHYLKAHRYIKRDRIKRTVNANSIVGFVSNARAIRLNYSLEDLGFDRCFGSTATVRASFSYMEVTKVLPSEWAEQTTATREFAITSDGFTLEIFRNPMNPKMINLAMV